MGPTEPEREIEESVTDRDEVVAEIKQPSPWSSPGGNTDWDALLRLAHGGKITIAKERKRSKSPPPAPPPFKAELMNL